MGPHDGVGVSLHIQQVRAGCVSRWRSAQRLDVCGVELLWSRAVSSFSRDDSRERHAGEDLEGFRATMDEFYKVRESYYTMFRVN